MENIITDQTAALHRHLGLGERDGMPKSGQLLDSEPLFFVECSPASSRGAKCKLATCNNVIESGQYRIAMNPAMSGPAWHASKNADFYHVACFEKIADLSKADFLDRIVPVTRATWHIRNINGMSVLDGNYLCNGGVERLVLEWKVQRGRWIDEEAGEEVESDKVASNGLMELLQKAGSSKFTASGPVVGVSHHEYFLLLSTLAPFESDGPEDTEEWNLFSTFLSKDKESWHDPHDLSKMLTKWQKCVKLARSDDEDLDEEGKELKALMGEKGIRAVKRLSVIPMMDLQGRFRGQW